MAELVDAQDLGSCIARCVGSSPTSRSVVCGSSSLCRWLFCFGATELLEFFYALLSSLKSFSFLFFSGFYKQVCVIDFGVMG